MVSAADVKIVAEAKRAEKPAVNRREIDAFTSTTTRNAGGGKEAGRRFIDALQLFYHVANIGDARSLAIHPATTTHSQLTPEEQGATGISDGYVRLSVGIEHVDDIFADLERGLAAAGGIAKTA
jgi:O-acetylhomoserine/O-acetylserine sulfhydrylase-like pyridoxal-dependent enzyme